jgi:hypothetical protein
MKQRINTVKEEWKKLLTFGALGWVKSSQIWGKMGSTSPITRHERERKSSVKGNGGLGKKDCQMKWRAGDVVAGIYRAS